METSTQVDGKSKQHGRGTEVRDLCDTLSSRRANLKEWMKRAWDFQREGKLESFVVLLENAIIHSCKSHIDYKDDLIQVYTMLAAHFVYLTSRELGEQHAVWQEKVSNIILAMDELHIASNDAKYLLCRGFALTVTDSRLSEADKCFESVLRQIPHNVAALLGRCCLAYQRQEYRLALGYIKSVFYNFQHGPADVRVGMGHCYLKMGDLHSARRAFEVAVASNGRSLNALLGIAHLKLRERQQPATKEAVNVLCAAFQMNHQHPLVLTWLATHFYYSHDYCKLRLAAGNAYRFTNSQLLKAQNCFQIARSFHVAHNYDQAFDFYSKAVKHAPAGYVLPYLGLAQMCVRRGHLDEAEDALRTLLKVIPEQQQALRMLAALYAQREEPIAHDMAIQLFKKALKDKDFGSWLSLAAIYERKQLWQEAMDCYDKSISIYQTQHTAQSLPINWLNNVAALQMRLHNPKAALRSLDTALLTRHDGCEDHWQINTLRFNRARVLEELNLVEEAAQSYKQLIADYPCYFESYVRLSAMASKRNQIDTSEIDEITHLNLPEASSDRITQCLRNANESYMPIAVANLCVMKAQRMNVECVEEKVAAQRYVQKAQELYLIVFQENQLNLWATNGLGIALCMDNQLNEGQQIFQRICKTGNQCPEALLNFANVAFELNNYEKAIKRYKKCLQVLQPAYYIRVMHLLARTCFLAGQINDAKTWLLKARHLAPYNMTLLYNLCITIKEESRLIFSSNCPRIGESKRAKREIKIAIRFLEWLGEVDESFHFAKKVARECKLLRLERRENKDMNNIHEEPPIKRKKKTDKIEEHCNFK